MQLQTTKLAYLYNVTGGVDYNTGPYSVTFPIGSTNASFNITINNDDVLEDDEIFTLHISPVTSGLNVGTPNVQTTVYVTNNFSKYFINITFCTTYIRQYTCIRTYAHNFVYQHS